MLIIETPVFTRLVEQILTDEEYRNLQNLLVLAPDRGDLIRGSGGLRKLRWAYGGQGKRGGIRVIYYWITKDETLLMLYLYKKNRQSDLTSDQLKVLKKVVEECL